jgi:DNA-directed RNA polymerase subunit RPC12/RpoP
MICKKNIVRRYENGHSKIHRPRTKDYSCNICKKTFLSIGSAREHMVTHDKIFKCEFCKKKFGSARNLSIHGLTHDAKTIFQCDLCPSKFKYRTNIYTHMKVKHLTTPDKAFKCVVCKKRFGSARNLSIHELTHDTEKILRCDLCPRKFKYRSSIYTHMKAKHLSTRK